MADIRNTFGERSTAVAAALADAVRRVRREPERAAFLAAVEANIWSSLCGWRRVKKWVKPALLPTLAGRVLRSRAAAGEKTVGLLGLAGGLAGDVVLLQPHRLPQGVAGFAVNHAAYCWLMWRRGARPSPGRVIARAVPLAAALGLAARRDRGMLPVVAGYGAILVATSTLADDRALVRESAAPTLGLGPGGNLFLISDALLFSREMLAAADSRPARLADAGVMGTYAIAQLLLVDGLFAE